MWGWPWKRSRGLTGYKAMFRDREDAARQLAARLESHRGAGVVVAALARGAVPMGCHLAAALDAQLYVVVARKLGAPGNPELAIGAISDGNQPRTWLNEELILTLGLRQSYVDRAIAEQTRELKRREQAWGTRSRNPSLQNKTVILTDDGIATGATIRIAIAAIRAQHPARLVLAVPVAARETLAELRGRVDELICLQQPEPFVAVGAHFERFVQVGDDEVACLLQAFDARATGHEPPPAGVQGSPA